MGIIVIIICTISIIIIVIIICTISIITIFYEAVLIWGGEQWNEWGVDEWNEWGRRVE